MSNAIMSGEIVDAYKQIIDIQSQNHSDFITVLLWVFGIFLGGTWLWNVYGSIKTIDRKVEQKFEKEKEALMVQIKDELKMNVEKEIFSYTTELREIKADVYRSLAILASTEKVHNFSVYWWSQTLKVRLELGRSEMIRATVDCMIREVNASNDGKKIDLQDKKGVLAIVARIPDLLSSEKQELKKNIENNFSEDEK